MDEHRGNATSQEAVAAQRERIDLSIGALVQRGDTIYRITEVLDFDSVVATEVESGRATPLRIQDLSPVVLDGDEAHQASSGDLQRIDDKQWQEAMERYRTIEPFVGDTVAKREDVAARAATAGVSSATLYRWIKRYRRRRLVTDLIQARRGWQKGVGRIAPETDAVIDEVIENLYKTSEGPSDTETATEVRRLCHLRGIAAPSANTVRRRIMRIDEKKRLRSRGQKELAKNRFRPAAGHFPNADFPLAVVQIDHTPADIILVDDAHRKPVGRPWITLAMDIYSRMVVGYSLSFDAPSATSIALCVAHSVLPKEEWLMLHGVEAAWPVWGFPRTIHVDNGSDFRSGTFERACLQYGVNLEFRPVKDPRYGGHIERILGTFLREIHKLPGTTFSSVAAKGEYDAEKHASLTLSEFEEWFVAQITTLYHGRKHRKLGMTPLRQWEIGILGNSEIQGTGMPPRPADRLSVTLDFLPSFERTVQPNGVTIDDRPYYAEPLRHWIGATDLETGAKRKFVFRRDPRDISAIWFLDPDIGQYFKIPFAELTLPAISLWEYRRVRERLAAEGRTSVNEVELLHAITEQRGRVDVSKEKTKSARRQAQRRIEHEKKAPLLQAESETTVSTIVPIDDLLDGDVEDFGDFGDIA